jgi:hypothetical protein
VDRGLRLSGHAFITADRPVIHGATGRQIPLAQIDDTMVLHFLCNADFCKGVAKSEDDLDPKRGTGLLDLWSMASIYTDLSQWKRCRGERCEGPCPEHQPSGYNAVDAIACDVALPNLDAERRSKGIPDSLVAHVKEVSAVCRVMEDRGIQIDMDVVRELEAEYEERKDAIFGKRRERKWCGRCGRLTKSQAPCKTCKAEGSGMLLAPRPDHPGVHGYKLEEVWDAPFNPRSPAAPDWFKARGVWLKSGGKDDVQRALRRLEKSKTADPETLQWLQRLHEYKDAGKGLKAWFDERHVNALGLAHPRFIATATSTLRLASSGPNFQNIPKRGWGKQVRRAIVARDPSLRLLRADAKQLELRRVLWAAGVRDDYGDDAFTWLVQQAPELFEEASRLSTLGHSPRDVAKSVSHAGSLMEGITVLHSNDLEDSYVIRTARAGALAIHRDWDYADGLVAFTGVNLAKRLFGDESWASRKKALEIQEAYFGRFPQIRQWQRKATDAAERGWVQNEAGHYLTLRGSVEDKAKIAAAVGMQGESAIYIQEMLLDFARDGDIPLMQIHDELVFEVDRGWSKAKCYEFMQRLAGTSRLLDGFSCPIDVEWGDNWFELEGISGK